MVSSRADKPLSTPCYDQPVPARSGYILVGGKSSRFGRDKALVEIEGRPLALDLADRVRDAAGNVTLVGPPAKYEQLGLRVIPDSVADAGPLAGLVAALEDSASEWNLIVACDMPALHSDFLVFLFRQAETSDADIVLPISRDGIPEPLCAVYSRRARDTLRRAFDGGTRKITHAFGGLRVHRLGPANYAHLDPDGRLLTNLNTLEDWEAAGFHGK